MMYSMCYGRHTPGAHVHCAGGVGGGGGGGGVMERSLTPPLITGSSWVSSTDPDGLLHRPNAREAGFGSAESELFLEYMRNIHNFQVQILCVRVSNQCTRFVQHLSVYCSICVCVYVCVCMCVCVCMHVCMYVCMYICVFMYKYIIIIIIMYLYIYMLVL